jgi:hypothetical protein
MTNLPLFQLWQHGNTTCRITPATERAPYWVIVHEGGEPIHRRTFSTHNEAISYAVEELRRHTWPPE